MQERREKGGRKPLQLLQGITLLTAILSWAFTFTTAHTEDFYLGSANDLLLGFVKVSSVVCIAQGVQESVPECNALFLI